ncbi:MAG TPA: hypothetical protein VGP93_19115, partial [Polyangiaceae bacterium]|nr:hypothetical protein [Polyangiaceae bacterium]
PTVTFRLTVGAANDTEYCLGGQSACNIDWFWLLDTEGNTMSTGLSCGATSCDGCLATGCPLICLTPSPLSPEGDQATWNGVRYVEDTCGEGTLCQQPSCAAPGDYVARFCAYPLVGAGGSPGFDECSRAAQDPTCVEVPFSYPSSGVVEAVLE